mmetsp:Transcript_78303/g.226396  ORF Transcript_78303/g.226396 Transcript_78303/m.226396 type:complete len:378 (-) Transcript_78303:173-1306(-)
MVRILVASALSTAGLTATSAAVLRGGGAAVRAGGGEKEKMRPEVAAALFGEVAKSWVQAHVMSSEEGAGGAPASAQSWAVETCAKVANAVIQGSEGASDEVREYMAAVCMKDSDLQGSKDLCLSFASGLQGIMRGDHEFNRAVDPTHFCTSFYTGPVADAAKKASEANAQRAREAEAEAQRLTDEAEKHRAAEVERLRAMDAEATAAVANLSSSPPATEASPPTVAAVASPPEDAPDASAVPGGAAPNVTVVADSLEDQPATQSAVDGPGASQLPADGGNVSVLSSGNVSLQNITAQGDVAVQQLMKPDSASNASETKALTQGCQTGNSSVFACTEAATNTTTNATVVENGTAAGTATGALPAPVAVQEHAPTAGVQ